MDARAYNRKAWDAAVARGSEWTIPVDSETIRAARSGRWHIKLTPTKSIPREWFSTDLCGQDLLCLASGGGQQGPVMAAAGANVTVLDNSPRHLAQDRLVAERESLPVRTVEGDMAHLTMFADNSFDLIVHPCSNLFVPDVNPVWSESLRVLRPGGILVAAFMNPTFYIFDQLLADDGFLYVRHKLPYSDLESLAPDERQPFLDDLQPLEFGHTLTDQIGGQCRAGYVISDLYEDGWPGVALANYMPVFIVTRALKPMRRHSTND